MARAGSRAQEKCRPADPTGWKLTGRTSECYIRARLGVEEIFGLRMASVAGLAHARGPGTRQDEDQRTKRRVIRRLFAYNAHGAGSMHARALDTDVR